MHVKVCPWYEYTRNFIIFWGLQNIADEQTHILFKPDITSATIGFFPLRVHITSVTDICLWSLLPWVGGSRVGGVATLVPYRSPVYRYAWYGVQGGGCGKYAIFTRVPQLCRVCHGREFAKHIENTYSTQFWRFAPKLCL